jgi:hypothetical protein
MTRTNEAAARLLGSVQDVYQAKDQHDKNREDKKYARGGSVRGNGIAKRGLTKGKMR